MRSRAALAMPDDGAGGEASIACFTGFSRFLAERPDTRGSSDGIDTTIQRTSASSFRDLIAVNTCVPIGASGFSILTGVSNKDETP